MTTRLVETERKKITTIARKKRGRRIEVTAELPPYALEIFDARLHCPACGSSWPTEAPEYECSCPSNRGER